MEAITTIDKANITVWLIPAIIVSFAIGNSTLKSFCEPVLPNASDASTNSSETCLIPKLVKRTVGGVAKIKDANTPGTIPIPEKALDKFLKNRSEEHTSELQSRGHLVCRLLLE